MEAIFHCQPECFVCGNPTPANLGLRRTGFDGDSLHAELIVTDAHLGHPGFAHGGMLAAAMDEVLGSRACLLGYGYMTAQLDITYLAAVPSGSMVYLSARCSESRGRKARVAGEARIAAPDGTLAVRAEALFIRVG
jgi:acyl-coenzyme A thioesterase PaaI-like protein